MQLFSFKILDLRFAHWLEIPELTYVSYDVREKLLIDLNSMAILLIVEKSIPFKVIQSN